MRFYDIVLIVLMTSLPSLRTIINVHCSNFYIIRNNFARTQSLLGYALVHSGGSCLGSALLYPHTVQYWFDFTDEKSAYTVTIYVHCSNFSISHTQSLLGTPSQVVGLAWALFCFIPTPCSAQSCWLIGNASGPSDGYVSGGSSTHTTHFQGQQPWRVMDGLFPGVVNLHLRVHDVTSINTFHSP